MPELSSYTLPRLSSVLVWLPISEAISNPADIIGTAVVVETIAARVVDGLAELHSIAGGAGAALLV